MKDINTVCIIGRLTREISEQDYGYAGGIQRLNISITCYESTKIDSQWGERANYFDVTIFGKTAEVLRQYLHTGKQVAVIGRLQQQRWEKDGKRHSKVVIIAQSVQLLGGQSQSTQPSLSGNDSYDDDFDDAIPF